MDQMENTYNENTNSLNSILSKYDEVLLAHTSDIKRVNEKIMADREKFLQDYNERCLQLEARSKFLEHRDHELKKIEEKLLKEKRNLELKKSVRERLSSCKQLVNECYSSRKIADGLKNELDALHKRKSELESQLKAESFKSLQIQITQLEIALQAIQDDGCTDLQQKLIKLQSELKEKNEKLQELKNWSNALSLTIEDKNSELQDAFRELIVGLKTCPIDGCIGIKTMDLTDPKPFFIRGYYDKKTQENEAKKFAMVCTYLFEDQNWHPFTVGSDKKEIIDEEDEKMIRLKAVCNDEQYRTVVTALNERKRYGLKGWECMQVLWDYKEKREVNLREGIDYILKEWKIYKKRKVM